MRKSHESISMTALVLLASVCAGSASGQAVSVPPKAGTRIPHETAAKTALARVPGGNIQHSLLQKDEGILVYWFEIYDPTSRTMTEVEVDAISGKVRSEKKQAAADDSTG